MADEYNAITQEAIAKGILKAPSFSVENEIFWGDNKLENAIQFLRESERLIEYYKNRYF